MEKVYLCLGGNVGDTRHYLEQTISMIESRIGTALQKSSVYWSEPWGFSAEQMFLNQIVVVETALEPEVVLEHCLQIETELGRTRSGNGYEPRVIDIDIIFFGSRIIDSPNLKVPHPLMHQRNFVLKPLCEIAPDFVHPVFKSTVKQLAYDCGDNGKTGVADNNQP